MSWIDTEAICVGRRRLSGPDRLLTLLTPDHGRLAAVARGAALPKGEFGSALEPFGRARVILVPARGQGYYRVESADRIDFLDNVRADLGRTLAAGLMCAWSRALSREREGDMYALLWHGLSRLDAGDAAAPVAARFLWRLAEIAGVGPELSRCVACEGQGPPAALRVTPGGAVCANCRRSGDLVLDDEMWAALPGLCGRMDGNPSPPETDVARRLAAVAQGYLRRHFGEGLP